MRKKLRMIIRKRRRSQQEKDNSLTPNVSKEYLAFFYLVNSKACVKSKKIYFSFASVKY